MKPKREGLSLTRKVGEYIDIGKTIRVTLEAVDHTRMVARLRIKAPPEFVINRSPTEAGSPGPATPSRAKGQIISAAQALKALGLED